MIYNINELFLSIQGEGRLAGMPAFFIRAQGCPIGCPWCDSGPNYAPSEGIHVPSHGNTWPGNLGTKMTEYEIVARIPDGVGLIVITGGEPALQNWDAVINLLESIRGNRRHTVALETSGQYKWLGDRYPDWITVSPKWSGQAWAVNPCYWPFVKELKYVVDEKWTPEIVTKHLQARRLGAPNRANPEIVLMPEGCPPSQENIERVLMELRVHPEWYFGPRLQYWIGVK